MNVLVVCTGNTCRSPMLAAMLAKRLEEMQIQDVFVDSAGLARDINPYSSLCADTLEKHSVNFNEKGYSKYCDKSLFDAADIVITMTRSQADFLRTTYGDGKIISLYDLTGRDVCDPYGKSADEYEKVFCEFCSSLDIICGYITKTGF